MKQQKCGLVSPEQTAKLKEGKQQFLGSFAGIM